MSNKEVIAKSSMLDITDVVLSYNHDTLEYEVKYTGEIASFAYFNDAFDEYKKLIDVQYDDYR